MLAELRALVDSIQSRNAPRADSGVYIYAGSNNLIAGNLIGTDATGTLTAGFGSQHNGVTIDSAYRRVSASPRSRVPAGSDPRRCPAGRRASGYPAAVPLGSCATT